MRYQLRFFANPNTVEIELFDIKESVAGADISFHRTEKNPRPPFVEALFALHRHPVLDVFLTGTSPKISITKRGRRRWNPLLDRILEKLRDHFDPGGPITENAPATTHV